MILESRPDWLLHGCLGTLRGIGGRWARPGLVLTGRQCSEGIERLWPLAPHEAGGGPVAGPGPLCPLLTQRFPRQQSLGLGCLPAGEPGQVPGGEALPAGSPGSPGEEGRTCQAVPS